MCWITSWNQHDAIRTLKCLRRTMAGSSQGWRLEWQEEGRGHIWSCWGIPTSEPGSKTTTLYWCPQGMLTLFLSISWEMGTKEANMGRYLLFGRKSLQNIQIFQFIDFLWFTLLPTVSRGKAVYRVDTSVFCVSCGETFFLRLSLAKG